MINHALLGVIDTSQSVKTKGTLLTIMINDSKNAGRDFDNADMLILQRL